MARRYSRREFLERLHAEIGRGRPLVMTGAGSGICAKFIERGGCDIIGVYNTGYFRMQGYGSLAGMLPIVQLPVELTYEPTDGAEETNVTPEGKTSVATTLVEVAGPFAFTVTT